MKEIADLGVSAAGDITALSLIITSTFVLKMNNACLVLFIDEKELGRY